MRTIEAHGELLYTASETASRLGISRQSLRRLVVAGVVTPAVQDSAHRIALFSDANIHQLISHYALRGGPRILPRRAAR